MRCVVKDESMLQILTDARGMAAAAAEMDVGTPEQAAQAEADQMGDDWEEALLLPTDSPSDQGSAAADSAKQSEIAEHSDIAEERSADTLNGVSVEFNGGQITVTREGINRCMRARKGFLEVCVEDYAPIVPDRCNMEDIVGQMGGDGSVQW